MDENNNNPIQNGPGFDEVVEGEVVNNNSTNQTEVNEAKVVNQTSTNKETESNVFGIISMISGIVSLVMFCLWPISLISSIVAIVLGIIGIKKPGKQMAIAGIITGAVAIVIWIFVLIFFIFAGMMEALA